MAITRGTIATLMSGSGDFGANMANNTASASAATGVDGSSNLDMFGDFELTAAFNAAPTDSNTVELYLIPCLDGTNYATTVAAGSSSRPPANYYRGSFTVTGTGTSQYLELLGVNLPPEKWKAQIYNASGVQLNNTSTLKYVPYKIG